MLTDAHAHLAAIAKDDPSFIERLSSVASIVCSASHDENELAATAACRGRGLSFIESFGIHPQNPVMDCAETLWSVSASRRIAAVGEAGFDFFGSESGRARNTENEAIQRRAFEFCLETAIRYDLPLIVHQRKALDLVFSYARSLARLPAVVFHSWSSPLAEALALVSRGVNAFFSFGAPIVNGNKKAMLSCTILPLDRVLLETDAPYQPPRGFQTCALGHIAIVLERCAALREAEPRVIEAAIERNFRSAYGLESVVGLGER